MFRICVQLLHDDVYQLWLNSHVLVRYAAINWIGHYGLIRDGTDGDLLELGLELCDTSLRKVETWWIAYCYRCQGWVAGTGDDLTVACAIGWRIVVERLIDDAAELEDAKRCYGLALISVFKGEYDDTLVDMLLERDLDINVRGEDGQTALQVACGSGCDEDTIEMLLEYGADINAVGELYGTALQVACLYADDEIIQILLDGGADVNVFGGQCSSALYAAFSRGKEEVVRLLLERGALSGDPPRSLLHPASESGNTNLVQFVLDSGVDIDSRDDIGRTPLMMASRKGHDSVIELLIVNGADVRATGGPWLNALIGAASWKKKSTMRLLLRHGARLCRDDWTGRTIFLSTETLDLIYDKSWWESEEEMIEIMLRDGSRLEPDWDQWRNRHTDLEDWNGDNDIDDEGDESCGDEEDSREAEEDKSM